MPLEDYFLDVHNSVRTRASADGSMMKPAFTLEAAERLSLADEIDSLAVYSIETTGARNRRIAIDGSDLDDEENQVVLAITDFRPSADLETLTTTDAKKTFGALEAFAQCALDGTFSEYFDPSTQAYQDAHTIRERHRENRLDKLRLYLLSNAKLSDKIKSFPSNSIDGVQVEFHVWGIDRFHQVETSELGRDEIDIDLTEWLPAGISALDASTPGSDVETLLLVIPGEVLANIYERHGSRVLESNVRSFLSNRGKVNKGIQGTLFQSPELFLPYNNGITATATAITATDSGGIRTITSIRDLQIVNGGQTTASLYYARRNEKIDLSRAFAQMKLIVVDDSRAQELVPKISRFANTQNKVSDSDFFSNHPFHVRMEEKSRLLWTPRQPGVHHLTKWFYERTRGQFLNEKNKLSTANAKKFETEFPKTQMITKTDAAKYLMTWDQQPHMVSSGAQKNFVAFANSISGKWDQSDLQFDDRFFRALVGKAILFRALESAVSQSDWYKANTGYRANIVTYTIARLALAVSVLGGGQEFNFDAIWNGQIAPEPVLDELLGLAESVREVLVDPSRPVENVTEWAKRPLCWDRIRDVPFDFPPELDPWLVSAEEAREKKKSSKSLQKTDKGIGSQTLVIELGTNYWVKLREFGQKLNELSDVDLSFISYATLERGKVPSEKQCDKILGIRDRMIDLGFSER